ncbi:gamma-glutamyltranspeptidase 1-like protein [Corchorus olitorius]|uniref:Gamma-glutamyltranspeptidase 1-like protein n=1 Tax=Corchorus olitorius TaxID=93759 RepID=A0A1R3JK85_9ROSI|nr:gamma-glutamyltranspeptidase 1-like protein [Corchorus olitorius]
MKKPLGRMKELVVPTATIRPVCAHARAAGWAPMHVLAVENNMMKNENRQNQFSFVPLLWTAIAFLFFIVTPAVDASSSLDGKNGSIKHRRERIVAPNGAVTNDDGLCSKIRRDVLRIGRHALMQGCLSNYGHRIFHFMLIYIVLKKRRVRVTKVVVGEGLADVAVTVWSPPSFKLIYSDKKKERLWCREDQDRLMIIVGCFDDSIADSFEIEFRRAISNFSSSCQMDRSLGMN